MLCIYRNDKHNLTSFLYKRLTPMYWVQIMGMCCHGSVRTIKQKVRSAMCKKQKWFLIGLGVLIFLNFFTGSSEITYTHVNTSEKCIIPDLDPFDPEVMKYVLNPKSLDCGNETDLVYISLDGFLTMNSSITKHYNNLLCMYHLVFGNGDYDIFVEKPVVFTEPVYVTSDVCYVICYQQKQLIWEKYLVNIDYRSVLNSRPILNQSSENMNVLLLGFDSMSRLAALRHLPKTMDFLENQLDAITFKGHTVLGDNTRPNLVPLFTGKSLKALQLTDDVSFYDDVPWIWKKFQEKGYITLLAEDDPKLNFLNYHSRGFKRKPSDHYLRSFYIALTKKQRIRNYLSSVLRTAEAMSLKLTSNSVFCYKNSPRHQIIFRYVQQFFHSYQRSGKFASAYLNELSHSVPSFLSLVDQDLLNLFQWFHVRGYLNNTVVFFYGDHGPRITDARNTATGGIEVRMPLLSVILPKNFKKGYPLLYQNMKNNAKVLTTHTDTYKTLLDIVSGGFHPQDKFKQNSKAERSLFQEISKERTCSDAEVQPHLCPCYQSHPIHTDSEVVYLAATFIINKINFKLKDHNHKCKTLKLEKIRKAEVQMGFNIEIKNKFSIFNLFSPSKNLCQRLKILLLAHIENALFEGTVDHCEGRFTLVGDITRNNKYGQQSSCCNKVDLKPFCICY